MQRIEKYAVIALVLLLVTILAVSLWSQRRGKNPFAFLKKGSETPELAQVPGSADPSAPAFETTGVGADPRAGLVPLGTQGTGAPQSLDGWTPGQAWKNRGRIAEQREADPLPVATTPPAVESLSAPASGFVSEGAATRSESSPSGGSKGAETKQPTLAAGATYVVRDGDTLGEIASRELGSFERWREIAALNGNLDPKRLRAGTRIVLPAGAKAASKPKVNGGGAVAPGGEYVVQKGDTLSEIAAKVLGKASRWTEIAELNPSIDAKRLVVGARLRLPKGVAVASGPVAKAERRNRVR